MIQDFTLYPNPSADVVRIGWSGIEVAQVMLVGLKGEVLWTGKNVSSGYLLDVSSFAPGIYFIRMNAEGKTGVKKLVIAR